MLIFIYVSFDILQKMQYHELQQANMDKAESFGGQLYVCSDTTVEPSSKLFSMRQYVFLSRQKDIFQNWPFAENYLELCLKYGVTNVLPPLEVRSSSERTSILYGKGKVTKARDDHEVPFEATISMIHEQVQLMSLPCNELEHEKVSSSLHYLGDKNMNRVITMNPSKVLVQKGKKTRKWRRKMKTMAEIFATAKHCTLEEVDRLNDLSCTSEIDPDKEGERRQKDQIDFECYCDSESELTDDDADYTYRQSKQKPVLKSWSRLSSSAYNKSTNLNPKLRN